MPQYSKPYLSVYEQVELLKSRGMVIDDVAKAGEYLQRIGYYRLSAYWYIFREFNVVTGDNQSLETVRLDEFKQDTHFAQIIDLYVFDKRLRLLLLDALERIEVAIRTSIALSIGKESTFAHHDQGVFLDKFMAAANGSSDYEKWLAKYENKLRDSREDFVEHFRTKYSDSDLPIWVAVEIMDFGDLSKLYGGIKPHFKYIVCNDFNIARPSLLGSWLHGLTIVRNICAHHGRLWNRTLNKPPELKSGEIPMLEHLISDQFANGKLYAKAAIACYLLRQINPNSSWPRRFRELAETFLVSPDISITCNAGFPDGWNEQALWN